MIKLPRGGALYGPAELKAAATVIRQVRKDYEEAVEAANQYADNAWSRLPWYKRIYIGIGKLDLWWKFYESELLVRLKQYKGSGLVSGFGNRSYTNTHFAADDIITLADAGRDCWLTPTQISVMNLIAEHTDN